MDTYGGHSRKLSNGGRVSTSGILSSLKSLLWAEPEERRRGSEDRGRSSLEDERGLGERPLERGPLTGQDNSSDDDDSGVHSR